MPNLRTLNVSDSLYMARFYGQICQIDPCLYDTAAELFKAMVKSPLAYTVVSLDEQGRIDGFCLATTDRQRLLSELFSRIPLTVTECIFTYPKQSRQLLRLFASPIKAKHSTAAEIIYIAHRDRDTQTAMLRTCLQYLQTQGIDTVYAHTYEKLTAEAIEAAGFEAVQNTGSACPNGLIMRAHNFQALAKCYKISVEGDKSFIPGPFTLADRLRCAFRWELMVVLPIYTLVLIPFASSLAYLAHTRIDRYLGLPDIVASPYNYLVFIALLLIGGLMLVHSYSYLILEGEGGPVPPWSSKTRRLVTNGPYTYVRHPSVIAKLIGVIGLAFAFNSWAFLLIVIPLLLCWSIGWNGLRQDGDLVEVFGDEYLEYKNRTPMLIPRFFK